MEIQLFVYINVELQPLLQHLMKYAVINVLVLSSFSYKMVQLCWAQSSGVVQRKILVHISPSFLVISLHLYLYSQIFLLNFKILSLHHIQMTFPGLSELVTQSIYIITIGRHLGRGFHVMSNVILGFEKLSTNITFEFSKACVPHGVLVKTRLQTDYLPALFTPHKVVDQYI